MYILIGDIGNTNIKLCLIESKNFKIKKLIYFKSKKIYSKIFLTKIFKKLISNKLMIKNALFSSVVPEYYIILKKFIKNSYKIKLKEIKEKSINKIISINVSNKKQVGSDRIANAIAVYKKNKNFIVIDFGTATTLDVITHNIYLGGVIAPGVKLSLETLISSATLIPKVNLSKIKKVIGNNTKSAVKSGFYWGYSGLIISMIKLIIKQTSKSFDIILTGGLAHLYKDTLNRKVKIDKDLTIKGLIKILKFF